MFLQDTTVPPEATDDINAKEIFKKVKPH